MHTAIVVEDVLFVQRPADALNRSTLDLPLHVAWVDGLTSVLESGETHHVHLAGLGVNLNVGDMDRECAPDTGGSDIAPPDHRAAGAGLAGGEFLERQPQLGVGSVGGYTVLVFHQSGVDVPDAGGALDELVADVQRRFVAGPAGLEGDAAAAGHGGVPDRVGVAHRRAHVLSGDAQDLGQLHGNCGARAADVGRPFDQADSAVRVDAGYGAGRAAGVEPVTRCHAPAPEGAPTCVLFQRSAPVLVVFGRLQSLDVANLAKDRASEATGALLGAVEQAELQGVHPDLLADFVQHRFDGKGRRRSAWGAVGGGLWLIVHHVEAFEPSVGYVVGAGHALDAGVDRRAGIRSGLIGHGGVNGGDASVVGRAHLAAHPRPGGRA